MFSGRKDTRLFSSASPHSVDVDVGCSTQRHRSRSASIGTPRRQCSHRGLDMLTIESTERRDHRGLLSSHTVLNVNPSGSFFSRFWAISVAVAFCFCEENTDSKRMCRCAECVTTHMLNRMITFHHANTRGPRLHIFVSQNSCHAHVMSRSLPHLTQTTSTSSLSPTSLIFPTFSPSHPSPLAHDSYFTLRRSTAERRINTTPISHSFCTDLNSTSTQLNRPSGRQGAHTETERVGRDAESIGTLGR